MTWFPTLTLGYVKSLVGLFDDIFILCIAHEKYERLLLEQ